MARFIESDQAEEIVANLNERGLIDYAHRAELYHALIEIAESILKIYGTILPELEAHIADDPEDVRDILFELRDEFRHIESHILDAKLTDVEWPRIESKGS